MSHIVEFSVDGLAGHNKTFKHRLDRNLNIFYGLNGSGKTSLIKILHSAMSGNADLLENVPFTSAIVKIYSINYKTEFIRSIERKEGSESTKVEPASDIDSELVFSEYVTEYVKLCYSEGKKTSMDSGACC